MKLTEKIGLLLFIIGLIFKFLHYPGAPILMIISIIILIIFYFINLLKKNIHSNIIIGLTSTLWLIFILFKIQYWSYATIPLFLGLPLTTYAIISIVKKKYYSKFQVVFLGVIIIFCSLLLITPTHKLYYTVNLNPLINQEVRTYSYRAWNKYSWFLYLDGHMDKALNANEKAIISAKNYLKKTNLNNSNILLCLNINRQKIIYDTWYQFKDCEIKY